MTFFIHTQNYILQKDLQEFYNKHIVITDEDIIIVFCVVRH